MLPGAGGIIAAVAIIGVVLLMGGSDSGRTGGPQPKSVLAPAKVEGSSEDLAATIASLNKAQLQVASLASSGKAVDPKELDRALTDVSANAMRAAELSNVMSQTALAQGNDAPTLSQASAMSSQYESMAQAGYAQAIDAQNLRQQLAAGQASLPAITQTITAYGVLMWNNAVTVVGVDGNPFVAFLPGATPPVPISIVMQPAAVQQVIVQFGPSVSGWVAASSTFISWPVYVNLAPVRIFDPYDDALLKQMLTLEGQLDPFFSQRYALARLQQFRRRAEIDRIGMFSLTGVTNLVNDQAAKGTYVNMMSLPESGQLGLNMLLPNGIAVANAPQVRAGAIPVYPNGIAFGYANDLAGAGVGGGSPSGITALFAKTGADGSLGGPPTRLFMERSSARGALSLVRTTPGGLRNFKETLAGPAGRHADVDIDFEVTWSLPASEIPATIVCNGLQFVANSPAGSFTGSVTQTGAVPPAVVFSCNARNQTGWEIASVSRMVQIVDDKVRDDIEKFDADQAAKARQKQADDRKKIEDAGLIFPFDPALAQANSQPEMPPPPPPEDNTPPPATGANTLPANTGSNAPATNNNPPVRNNNPPVVTNNNPPAVTNNNPPANTNTNTTTTTNTNTAVESNRRDCLSINRGPLNQTERTWFAENCGTGGRLLTAGDCGALRANPPSIEWVRIFVNQTCPSTAPTVQQPNQTLCAAGTIDSGGVPAGSGSTKVPLNAACKYTVCLGGTITGTNTQTKASKSYTPASALMRASPGGSIAGGCVTLAGISGIVTFNCDPSQFHGITFSGSFSYTVQRVGPA